MTGPTEIYSPWKSSSSGGAEAGIGCWSSAYVPCISVEAFTDESPTAELFMSTHPIVDCGSTAS